jgi:hypothetical protein
MGSAPAPEIKVKITGEDTGVSAAIKELSLQLQQLKRTQDDAGTSAQKLGAAEAGAGRSMREAREGAKLLSEETGVHLSRGLTGILARSELLAPLLNAAFPVAAAIGFGEVIAHVAEKVSTMIADAYIYTDAMKESYKTEVQINTEIAKRAEHIKQLGKAFELIGLKGADKQVAEIKQLGTELEKVQKTIDDFDSKRGAARLGILGTGGTEISWTDDDAAKLGDAQSKKKELEQEQYNAEKQAMADAAEKAKTERNAVNKAKLAQIEAGFANELSLYKAQHAKLDQDNEADYVKGIESLAAYYARKKQLAAESSQKDIDALTGERSRVLSAPTKDKAEEIANQTKAAGLANQIAIAKVNAAKTAQQLTNEQAQKQDELDKKTLDYQSKIAQAQGLKFDEAKARIEAEAVEMARTLREAGIAPDQIDAMVAKFKSAETQKAQFAGIKSSGQDATAALSDDEADIRLKNIAIVAQVKVLELERQRIPVLQAIAAQMKAAAITPDQVKEADDYARSVDRIAIAAQKSSVSMKTFDDQASQAIAGDLTNFLGSTIDHVHGVGDAFAQLANSVVSSIQRIVAQLLVQIVTQKLLKSVTQSQDDGSGDSSGGGGGGLGSILGLFGAAGGGLVSGPGTGTSDSIPARLSAGEFVMRASSVRDIGADTLARMNRGLNVGSIRGMYAPRFAEGGLVTHGSGSNGVDLNMNLGLEEGLVLKHLSSKAAGKIVLSHVANNPKAVTRAISRGGSQ